MPLLPVATQDFILRELSPIDRLRYSKVNRDAYHIVQSFNRRAFRVEKVLYPYFDDTEINEFRRLQLSTGMLISGSTALQFFDLSTYSDSDLDVYIEIQRCTVVTDFLKRIDYEYTKSKEDAPDFDDALQRALELAEEDPFEIMNMLEDDINGWEGYMNNGIVGVFNFMRSGKKVQVIACRRCPMSVILGYHSTCVMNVISHSHAYSLFPRATFHERVSVMIRRYLSPDHHHQVARDKYKDRGWTMLWHPLATSALCPQSEFRFTSRCVGDSACWTIPLSPLQGVDDLESGTDAGVDPTQANAWLMEYEIDRSILSFEILRVPGRLNFSYCYSNWRSSDFGILQMDGDSEYIDNQMPAIVHKMVNKKPGSIDEDIPERVRSLLEHTYNSMPELTDRVDRKQPIIFPNARTARMLSNILQELFECFRVEPVIEFDFRVGISTPDVWTNVTVFLPDRPRRQWNLSPITFSTNEYLVSKMKSCKIGWKTKDLEGDIKPAPFERDPRRRGMRSRGVQTVQRRRARNEYSEGVAGPSGSGSRV